MADLVEAFHLYAEGHADWVEMYSIDFREAQNREPSRWTLEMPKGVEIHDKRGESPWAKLRALQGAMAPLDPAAEIDHAKVRQQTTAAMLAQDIAGRRTAAPPKFQGSRERG